MKPGGGMALAGVGIAAAAIIGIVAFEATRGGGGVCSAVGYVPTVTVRISGNPSLVHDVRLCTTGGCSAPVLETLERYEIPGDAASPTAAPGSSAPATPDPAVEYSVPEKPTGPELPAPVPPTEPAAAPIGATPRPQPTDPAPQFGLDGGSTPQEWTFLLRTESMRVSATAYGADGHRLAARDVTLHWKQQHTACPVAPKVGPVTLHVGP